MLYFIFTSFSSGTSEPLLFNMSLVAFFFNRDSASDVYYEVTVFWQLVNVHENTQPRALTGSFFSERVNSLVIRSSCNEKATSKCMSKMWKKAQMKRSVP